MKKKVIIYNVFLAIIILCTSVYAALNANLGLQVNNETVKPGDEFIVTLSLRDIENSNGVNSIDGYISVDKNVIENITFNSLVFDEITTDSNGNPTGYKIRIGNETLNVYDVTGGANLDNIGDSSVILFNGNVSKGDCKIVIDLKNKVKTEDLIKIKFKVKSNVADGTYNNVVRYELFEATGTTTSDQAFGLSGNVSIGVRKVSGNTTDGNNIQPANNVVNNTVKNTVENKVENKVQNKVENKVQNKVENKIENKVNNSTNNNVVPKDNTNKNGIKTNITNTKDNTVANKTIPSAGTLNVIAKIVAVGAILGFALYVKYKKYRNI